MKKGWLILLLISFLGLGRATLFGQQYGLGFIFVEPTGLSGKIWIPGHHSLAGAIGWSPQKDNPLLIHGDYLPPSFLLFSDQNLRIAFYYGIGGRIKFRANVEGGFRFPLGIDFLSRRAPLNFFLELVPVFDLAPETKVDLRAALGVRYLFGSVPGRRL